MPHLFLFRVAVFVSDGFEPSFDDFQRDVERYLKSIGKRTRSRSGLVVFRGYPAALNVMFDRYLEAEAFDPLISHFRTWNWEYSYDDRLLRLTDALTERRDWLRVERLWSAVIAKRRKLYNGLGKLRRDSPEDVPEGKLLQARDRLLDTLLRVKALAVECGAPERALREYTAMRNRILEGRRA